MRLRDIVRTLHPWYRELGNLVLLHLHVPTAAPSSVSRGNGYTPPGWLILNPRGLAAGA